jgi:hypothetical protein
MKLLVRDGFAYAIVLAVSVLAALRAAGVRARLEGARMSDPLAHQVYLDVTDQENDERRGAALQFEGSLWSRQDEFHAKERVTMRHVATIRHVSVSGVVNAIDRGMREHWPVHAGVVVSQKVIPCRPRLAY